VTKPIAPTASRAAFAIVLKLSASLASVKKPTRTTLSLFLRASKLSAESI